MGGLVWVGNEDSQSSPTLDSYRLRWYFWVANENARDRGRDDTEGYENIPVLLARDWVIRGCTDSTFVKAHAMGKHA
jgi:hypothetical protein